MSVCFILRVIISLSMKKREDGFYWVELFNELTISKWDNKFGWIHLEYQDDIEPKYVYEKIEKSVMNKELAFCECKPNTDIYTESVTKCNKCNKQVTTLRIK